MPDSDFIFFRYEPTDVDLLCESLWHSIQRGDISDNDRERMRAIREQLNSTRVEKIDAFIAVKDRTYAKGTPMISVGQKLYEMYALVMLNHYAPPPDWNTLHPSHQTAWEQLAEKLNAEGWNCE